MSPDSGGRCHRANGCAKYDVFPDASDRIVAACSCLARFIVSCVTARRTVFVGLKEKRGNERKEERKKRKKSLAAKPWAKKAEKDLRTPKKAEKDLQRG